MEYSILIEESTTLRDTCNLKKGVSIDALNIEVGGEKECIEDKPSDD